MPKLNVEALWEIERDLSEPPFRGVPLGSAVAGVLGLEVFSEGDWSLRAEARNRAAFFYHRLFPLRSPKTDLDFCQGRVLVTWVSPETRFRNLVFPVAECLGHQRSVLFCRLPDMLGSLPPGVRGASINQTLFYDVRQWRHDYGKVWHGLRPRLRGLVRQFHFSEGVYHRLAMAIVVVTQRIAGFQEFLRYAPPAAILTEHDRNSTWASLILTAKTLGIPTYTLVHGTLGEKCRNFYPVLADKVFCWGQFDRDKFVAAGLDPSRAVIGGCPRLTRALPLSPQEARLRLGFAAEKPLVLLGTALFRHFRLKLAETFCRAVRDQDKFSAMVRLHPSETLDAYAELIARYPGVRFTSSQDYPLDEVLAAADVVVVHSSGLGSDALVKRRLAVVLDVIDMPLSHGQDLVDAAGCPKACSASELTDVLARLLFDEQERTKCRRAAEQFVGKFCDAFGEDSAERIARHVLDDIAR
jgi:hypothetical protein